MIVIVCLLLISYVLYFYSDLVNFVVFYLYFHWGRIVFFDCKNTHFFLISKLLFCKAVWGDVDDAEREEK